MCEIKLFQFVFVNMYRFIVYKAGSILGVFSIVSFPHAHRANVYDSLHFEIDRVLSMGTWTRVEGGWSTIFCVLSS